MVSGRESWLGGRRVAVAALILASLLLLLACDGDGSGSIQWQLPLTSPPDPHGAQQSQALPAWAAMNQGSARFMLLQTGTARTFSMQVSSGASAEVQGVRVRLLGLAAHLRMKSGTYIEDENVHNPAAYVEVSEKGRRIYRGWLYQEFPEMFGPDSPNWRLWLKQVHIKPSPDNGTSEPGARSSAG